MRPGVNGGRDTATDVGGTHAPTDARRGTPLRCPP